MLFAHLGRTGKAGAALCEEKGQLAQVRPVGDLRRRRKAPLHVQPGQESFDLQSSRGSSSSSTVSFSMCRPIYTAS